MDEQIDKRILLQIAETLVHLKAYLAASGEANGILKDENLVRDYASYVAQVRLSQPAIDQMRKVIDAETLEVPALNETLRLVLASVSNPTP